MLIHIFDRSDLESVVSYNPTTKVSKTLRDELYEPCYRRKDVVLINCTRNGKEFALYVTEKGFSGDLWILEVLDESQYNELQGIAKRMRENAISFKPARKLLGE